MQIPLKRYFEVLARYLARQRWRFAGLSGLVLASIGLQIANPQIMRFFIDAVVSGRSGGMLGLAAGVFLALAVLQQGLSVGAAYTGESVAWTATNALREDLAAHCLTLDMRFHNERSPGEFIERIEGDATELANFFSQLVTRVAGNLLLLCGILLTLTALNWRLGLCFTLFTGVTLLGLNLVRNVAVPYHKAHRDAETDLFAFLEEALAGTEDIRSCGAVAYMLRRLYHLQAVILKRWRMSSLMHLCIGATAGLLLMGGYGLAFFLGYRLYLSGAVTIGTAYLVVHYTNLIARPIRELSQQVENLQNIGATVERMSELLRQKSRITDGPGAALPAAGASALEFEEVGFAYADGKPVLAGLSFTLAPGRIMGLLGRTGVGKTTLARLVFRLYDPDAGCIRLDGHDIRGAKLAQVRSRVAYVTQDVQLFQASVRQNITFFGPGVSDARLLEVIEALGLMEWLAGLPEGLDTRLETGGRSLSAGEAQLLALTRVFLRNPGLVILDEASSRLDPATERLVERAIDRLLRGRTAIVIAHRLATVDRADEILILDEGGVVEHGDRLKLLADPRSRFYALRRAGMEEVLA
ncbi:MAG: ABC transporter ATP-binding protein [Patescibacteria group bacterium]